MADNTEETQETPMQRLIRARDKALSTRDANLCGPVLRNMADRLGPTSVVAGLRFGSTTEADRWKFAGLIAARDALRESLEREAPPPPLNEANLVSRLSSDNGYMRGLLEGCVRHVFPYVRDDSGEAERAMQAVRDFLDGKDDES